MFIHRQKFVVILALALVACNGADDQEKVEHQQSPSDTPSIQNSPHTGTPAVTVPSDTTPSATDEPLPAEKKDSIQLEGSSHPINLKLIQPPGADPPFRTYMPKDFAFDPVSSGEGTGYYFYTNFVGTRNPNAYLLVFVFPDKTTEAEARARAKDFMTSRGVAQTADEKRFTFSRDGQQYSGGVDVRSHGGRYYYIARQYPLEMAEGFGPRARKITDNWTWLT